MRKSIWIVGVLLGLLCVGTASAQCYEATGPCGQPGVAFTPATNYMSRAGWLRLMHHEATGEWLTRAEAQALVDSGACPAACRGAVSSGPVGPRAHRLPRSVTGAHIARPACPLARTGVDAPPAPPFIDGESACPMGADECACPHCPMRTDAQACPMSADGPDGTACPCRCPHCPKRAEAGACPMSGTDATAAPCPMGMAEWAAPAGPIHRPMARVVPQCRLVPRPLARPWAGCARACGAARR